MRILSIFIYVVLSLTAAQAGTKSMTPAGGGQTVFSTPSGNIGCTYTPQGGTGTYMPKGGGPELSCDRPEPDYLRFILGPSGQSEILSDAGDRGCCSDEQLLPYGAVSQMGPFVCSSALEGLTCHRNDGHGFFISRNRADRW